MFDLAQAVKKGETVPFSAEGKRIFSERRATESKDDPSARCLPTGLPVRALLRTPFKIIQTPPVMAILYRIADHMPTDHDRRPSAPTWTGPHGTASRSAAGRATRSWPRPPASTASRGWIRPGYPASDALRITERFRRRDFGHIEMEMVIDDKKMYTKPWSIFSEFILQADTELLEFICEENEKDSRFSPGNNRK